MTRRLQQSISFILLSLITATYILLGSGEWSLLFPQAAIAQSSQMQAAAESVYQRLPDLPKENQYVRRETGKVATDSTLVQRLIQYHVNVKGRSPQYRLDWKLTLADYLGVNEYLIAAEYPGKSFLRTNPMEADRTVIQQLNRGQRDALIQSLVDFYGRGTQQTIRSSPSPQASPATPAAPATERTRLQPLPSPGAAELLLPPASGNKTAPRPTGDAQLLLP